MNFKALSVVFVALTVILGGSTAFLASNPSQVTRTLTTTQDFTTTQATTVSITNSTTFTINIAYKTGIGYYLTNATGFTLYFRDTDTPGSGKTTCTSSVCEKNWPAFYAAALSLPPGLSSSSFSTITPYNNTKITTFDGFALFYWIGDKAPGDTSGQDIGDFYAAFIGQPGQGTTTSSSVGTSTTSSATSTTISSTASISTNSTSTDSISTTSIATTTTNSTSTSTATSTTTTSTTSKCTGYYC